MSQITRCPSCATAFKVVADQLRISEGWVRCGQCKEVFDAAAHLLPAAPPALLPNVSLTDTRPPPVPVTRKADADRVWGEAPASRPVRSETVVMPPGLLPTGVDFPGPSIPSEPVLAVPAPAVPAFLAADSAPAASVDAVQARPLTPFAWRARGDAPAPQDSAPQSQPGGYELPGGDGGDEDEALPDEPSFEETVPADLTSLEYPALELPVRPPAPVPSDPATPETVADPVPLAPTVDEASEASESAAASAPGALPSIALESPVPLALVVDDSPAAVLQAKPRKTSPDASPTDDEEPGAHDAQGGQDTTEEVSFVLTARRKAFWRKPAVRAMLVVLLLAATLGLVAQVAVQERDRIAALDARARPWLLKLCAPLRCDIAPQRQIADVVIDSSSFNKARGDSYQLALAMKSKAGIPLAMPAVELTLTDAQDQPVLRRVLLPADMGAPAELPARGEWATSVSVIVTTGGARVAGYRLLAFYP